MRNIFICSLIILFSSLSAFAGNKHHEAAQAIFVKAQEAYKVARYDEAVRLNEEILSLGVESPAVYYNLGNSYFRSRNVGKAVVNYLRAKAMAPRDSDIRANLAFARSVIENSQSVQAQGSLPVLVLSNKLSFEELKWLSLFVFMFLGFFVIWGLYARLKRRRILLGAILLGLVFAYVLSALLVKGSQERGLAVSLRKAEARFEPSDKATIYFKLSEGAELKVIREKDGWLKVERPDSKIGWVLATDMERL